jgi:pimeloyl-ACP methyl ester carboxylesterase
MNPRRPRAYRLSVVLSCSAFVLAIIVACGPFPTPGKDQVSLCALDPVRGDCVTGAFQALHRSQTVRLTAVGSDGKALAHTAITLNVAGANAHTAGVNTDAGGAATYAYTGIHAGTDSISVTVAQSDVRLVPGPIVVHWVTAQSFVHPIVFVHGINEDASIYRHAINQDDPSVTAQHKEGSELFEALDLVYDRGAIEAFCYQDDRAYEHAPSGCPAPESAACVSGSAPATCVSQSAVDGNAVELATVIQALSARTGGQHVTLIGYSMGAAIIRTLLAGCRNATSVTDTTACAGAVAEVDSVFFLNGAQQGSWLMTVKAGWDAASLSGQEIPSGPASPFAAVLPLLEQAVFQVVKDKLQLDVANNAERDLTPQSANIIGHNMVAPPSNIDLYNFYGDIQLQISVNVLAYQLPGKETLPLGDLVLLAQDDGAQSTPLWGGAALCDGCASPITPYRESAQYHAWALLDRHTVNMDTLAPLLGSTTAVSAIGAVVNSPVQHLNVTQPLAQAPGSAVQVRDITGRMGGATTDITGEILAILMQKDGLA